MIEHQLVNSFLKIYIPTHRPTLTDGIFILKVYTPQHHGYSVVKI